MGEIYCSSKVKRNKRTKWSKPDYVNGRQKKKKRKQKWKQQKAEMLAKLDDRENRDHPSNGWFVLAISPDN